MNFFKLFLLGIRSIFYTFYRLIRYFGIGFINVFTFIPKYFIDGILIIFKKRKKENVLRIQKDP